MTQLKDHPFNPSELIKCPDCGKEIKRAGLGMHRFHLHGYRPKEKSKKQGSTTVHKRLTGEFPCSHCKFVAKWKGGLTKHIGAMHPSATSTEPKRSTELATVKVTSTPSTNGHRQKAHRDHPATETAVAFALGRFEALCSEISSKFNLPPLDTSRAIAAAIAGAYQEVR